MNRSHWPYDHQDEFPHRPTNTGMSSLKLSTTADTIDEITGKEKPTSIDVDELALIYSGRAHESLLLTDDVFERLDSSDDPRAMAVAAALRKLERQHTDSQSLEGFSGILQPPDTGPSSSLQAPHLNLGG